MAKQDDKPQGTDLQENRNPGIDPAIVEQVKIELINELSELTAKQLAENIPDVYNKIKKQVTDELAASPSSLKVPGFLIEKGDPFGEGVARIYGQLNSTEPPTVPFVVPFINKNAKAAIGNYILRAKGASDSKRAAAAEEALKKCK